MSKESIRYQRSKIYDASYMNRGIPGDPCAYCGQVSDTMDHIPPLSMVASMSATGQECQGPFIKVPACRECNTYLTTLIILTVKGRRKYIKDRLRKKYQHFLRIPNWDEEELEEMSPKFADEIRASVKFANAVRMRLAWMR